MSADVHMLSGAYAIDAVEDAAERHRFEDHLDECEACRVEVRSLREAVVVLGDTIAVPPPRSLRHRVMAQVTATPQAPRLAPRMPRPPAAPVAPVRRRAGLRVAAAAAAAAVVVIGGGGLAVGGIDLLRARQTDDQAQHILAIAANPAARRVAGSVSGGGTATVFVAGTQAALIASGVPGLTDGRTYQLWLVRSGQVLSAGLGPGGAEAGGRWSRLITGVRAGDKVAISIEPSGGSAKPTTTPLSVIQA
jgi:anti-sigma-K factor RskA